MRFILLVIILLVESVHASVLETPPPNGNFALPRSQQPGAAYSFGSNILDPGQLQGRTTPNIFKSTGRRDIGSGVTLLYGTSEKTSLLFSLPITPSRTGGQGRHAGLGDAGLQGEYEFYRRSSFKSIQKAAVLASFTLPTGTKDFSSEHVSYFIGGTFNQTWTDWIVFAAPGLLRFGGNPKNRPAPRYYYELGVGRNLTSQSGDYILTGFVEVNGQYDPKEPSPTPVTRNSGGNILSDGNLLFFTPSLFFSTKKWIVELGVSLPVTQHWIGTRKQVNYYAGTAIAYTFD